MKQHILNLLKKRWTIPAVTGAAGFGGGFLVGYSLTKKQYDKIEEELALVKEDQVRIDHVVHEREREFNLQIQQVARVAKDLRESGEEMLYNLKSVEAAQVEPERHVMTEPVVISEEHVRPVKEITEDYPPKEATVHNIFDRVDDEWDYKTEIESRDRSRPYIIHVDEYVNDEKGWDSQSTLTWYEKDRILCDSRDTPLYNPDAIVGELRFGHGSNDPNVVYIRNEELQTEYEVLRDSGSYEETVLGERMDDEQNDRDLKHSHNMRFRSD